MNHQNVTGITACPHHSTCKIIYEAAPAHSIVNRSSPHHLAPFPSVHMQTSSFPVTSHKSPASHKPRSELSTRAVRHTQRDGAGQGRTLPGLTIVTVGTVGVVLLLLVGLLQLGLQLAQVTERAARCRRAESRREGRRGEGCGVGSARRGEREEEEKEK